MSAGDGQHRQRPSIIQLLHPSMELSRREDGEEGTRRNIDNSKIQGIIPIVIPINPRHHRRLARRARNIRLIPPVAGPESQPEDLAAGGIGGADVGADGAEGVQVEGDIAGVMRVALGQDVMRGEVGGVDEAGDCTGDVGHDVAGALLLALEALDGNELQGRDGEVADGEVGHRGVCE